VPNRALIGVMVRLQLCPNQCGSAIEGSRLPNAKRRGWFRLHENGGKEHVAEYLEEPVVERVVCAKEAGHAAKHSHQKIGIEAL